MAEKNLNELPRDLRMLHTKATDAIARENYDYAIDLLNQILSREPAMHECRRTLRGAQVRRAGNSRGMFKKFLSGASASPLVAKGQLALRRDPVEALQVAEQILNSDPNNSSAHRIVVEAATALEMPRTAVLSLEILAANSPNDRDTVIRFANALADTGEVVRAEKLLAELSAEFPADNDISLALKNISARKTMEKGGYDALADGKGSYRDILKDEKEAVALEQQNRQVKTEDTAERLIHEYEARLKTDPGNLKHLRDLAELYTQKKQYDRALEYYEKIRSSQGGADSSLDRSIAETTSRKFDHELSQLDPYAPEFAEETARIHAAKQAYQLAECQKRADHFPTDLQIRFELGQIFFQMGKIPEAMKEFQKAKDNPHRRIQALGFLGQCFARRGINDLAASTLQDAIKEKLVFDDEKKELLYLLGSVYEKMGKRDDAIAQFKQIYAADVGYKDVAEKVEASYA